MDNKKRDFLKTLFRMAGGTFIGSVIMLAKVLPEWIIAFSVAFTIVGVVLSTADNEGDMSWGMTIGYLILSLLMSFVIWPIYLLLLLRI